MSDKNLQTDDFFYDKIVSAKDVRYFLMQGYIEVDLLLNCNKIKKLNVKNREQLTKAIKSSEDLELH